MTVIKVATPCLIFKGMISKWTVFGGLQGNAVKNCVDKIKKQKRSDDLWVNLFFLQVFYYSVKSFMPGLQCCVFTYYKT